MKAAALILFAALCLILGGCASDNDSTPDNPGDQPPGEKKDGLGIIPGGAGFKQTF